MAEEIQEAVQIIRVACIRYLCDGYCHVLHQSEKLYAG